MTHRDSLHRALQGACGRGGERRAAGEIPGDSRQFAESDGHCDVQR